MSDSDPIVHLRSGDADLQRHLQRMCALGGWRLRTHPPGAAVPEGAAVVDDADAPANRAHPAPGSLAVAATPRPGVLGVATDAHEILEALGERHAPPPGRVVAVAGVRGGLGATALAAAVAYEAQAVGQLVALVDLDPVGGGVELLLGLAHDPGPRWADLADDHGAFVPQRLRHALPSWQGVSVLSGDGRGGVDVDEPLIRLVIGALARACDVVVVDVPRHGLAPSALAGLGVAEDLLLLVGSDMRSAIAAEAALEALRAHGRSARLVGRVGRNPAMAVDDIAAALSLPLLATVRNDRGFDAALAHGVCPVGLGRGSLTMTARRIATALRLAE